MRREQNRPSRKNSERVNMLSAALHTEHAVALAALEALRAQMIENEVLKERIAELENK